MKKLNVFGILILFLVSVVFAVTLDSIGDQTGAEGSELTFTVTASDLVGPAEFFTNFTFGTLDVNSGVFSWTPNYTQEGVYSDIKFWVNDTGDNSIDEEIIDITIDHTHRAIANAGVDQNTLVNQQVTLDGTSSQDLAGGQLTYLWNQLLGPTVILSDDTNQQPTFTPTLIGTYQFELTVTAGDDSAVDDVLITVTNQSEQVFMRVKEIEVKVGSESWEDIENENGTTLDDELEPGDGIKFRVEIENLRDDDNDELKDVQINVEIRDWDEAEDDEEEESDEEDIDGDDDFEFKDLDFEPQWIMKGDGDTYDIIITITGEDDLSNVDYEFVYEYKVEVDKENDLLIINEAEVSPSEVSCRSFTNLNFEVINIGDDDQDDVEFTVRSDELDVFFQDEENLDSNDAEDSVYNKKLRIDVFDNVDPGVYAIEVEALYDDGDESETTSVLLTVNECSVGSSTDDDVEDTFFFDEEESIDVKIEPTIPSVVSDDSDDSRFPVLAQVQDDDFTGSTGYVALLVIGVLVLVGLIISILVLLLKKK